MKVAASRRRFLTRCVLFPITSACAALFRQGIGNRLLVEFLRYGCLEFRDARVITNGNCHILPKATGHPSPGVRPGPLAFGVRTSSL